MGEKINRKKVFNGRLLKVYSGQKKMPDGRLVYIEEIMHPGASIIIPYVNKKIVFLRQYRAVLDKFIWELPAGKIDPGETSVSCARRELKEETGFRAGKMKKLGFIYTVPGFCDEKIFVYETECVGKTNPNQDPDELLSVKLFSKKEIMSLFKKGKIVDAKTISALSFASIL